MQHFRPLVTNRPPAVGENLARGTVTLILATIGGQIEEHQLQIEESERVATRLFDGGPLEFVDVDGQAVATDMSPLFSVLVGQRLRDHASAVRTHVASQAARRLNERFA